ncbi:chromosome segregation protein ScpA [Rhodomicrobium udaipurense JA643]|uniref:Segregation and condensation protein A n=1 Tax=Rhodomicrobium udaipurense TaxID=1202716 RepID=A0A8I1GIJ2_9HYPH|nr:ScpA family protein [Rhodomicrobium udaipurense]KAI94536.1 chromosome segregation protein ScpA [Rhodomicrobium udaipurense JA643]MBJ7544400.1 segregation/condensation protein A [Rhodomicrobium udaipurense]
MSDETDNGGSNETRAVRPDRGADAVDSWDAPERIEPEDEADILLLELDGFEGPLDLLLQLARTQKVDLAKLSILDLANQYLAYIEAARALRLEIAADYLVMAAWLAYLKSKLLLPEKEQQEQDGLSGKELAAQLAFRLKRLEAMREALASLMGRKRLGVDLFPRGMPEGIRIVRSNVYQASIFDLLKAYAEQRQRTAVTEVKWGGRVVWSIKMARDRLSKLLGKLPDWAELDTFLEEYKPSATLANTVTASSFGATLELAREGYLELRQDRAFGPLYLKWLTDKPNGIDVLGVDVTAEEPSDEATDEADIEDTGLAENAA